MKGNTLTLGCSVSGQSEP